MKLKIIKKIIYPAPKKKNLEYLLSNKKKLSGMQKSWEMWPMVKKKKKKKNNSYLNLKHIEKIMAENLSNFIKL